MRFDDRIHQGSGGHPAKDEPRRFFYALFTGAYFTYTGILALVPEPIAATTGASELGLCVLSAEPLDWGLRERIRGSAQL